jgi:hypothetical protein
VGATIVISLFAETYPYATVWNEVNVSLIVAGALALLGAAAHGAGGQVLVVRRLSPETLPPSPLGGPRTTKAMIQATWHLTTIAFLAVGSMLLLSGSLLDGDAAQAIALAAAAASTAFAALVVALGAAQLRSPRSLFHHPAPALLTATAALAWLGALA